MESKKTIVENNFNLPPHEIKKKVRELYPDVTNDDIMSLIIEISKERRMKSPEYKKLQEKHNRTVWSKDDDYER